MKKTDNITLQLFGLPVINDLEDLSALIRVSKTTIYNCSKQASFHYKVIHIPKKNGGQRIIAQPSKKLKALQSWILSNILNKLKVSSSSKGFEKGTRCNRTRSG